MEEPRFTIEAISDPEAIARSRTQHERALRNSHWLESHWPDVLPQARGKFLAVAGQEAFIADSAADAWAWAAAAHPDDNGALVQYVFPNTAPRIYAHRG